MFRTRKQEADEFYEAITPPTLNRDEARRHASGAGRDALVETVLPL